MSGFADFAQNFECPDVKQTVRAIAQVFPEINKNELMILLREKFKSERGRINCSLWEEGGKWRWLGIQYVIAEY